MRTPTPALISQILTSTATDLGAPGQEQGAGLLNAYGAVELAESITGSGVTPTAVGNTLDVQTSPLNFSGLPGTSHSSTIDVTNTGTTTETVNVSTRTFGPQTNVQGGTVELEDSPTAEFENDAGVANNYEPISFTVPSGADRLVGQIAWPVNQTYCDTGECNTDLNSRVHLVLIDPDGDIAADSIPQGSGSYGERRGRPPAGRHVDRLHLR